MYRYRKLLTHQLARRGHHVQLGSNRRCFHARTPSVGASLYHSTASSAPDHSLSDAATVYLDDQLCSSAKEEPSCYTHHTTACWPDSEPLQLLMPCPYCADTKPLKTFCLLLVGDQLFPPSWMQSRGLAMRYCSEWTTSVGYFTRSHKFFSSCQNKNLEYMPIFSTLQTLSPELHI